MALDKVCDHHDWLSFWKNQNPEKIAFIDGVTHKRWSYHKTFQAVCSIAQGLKSEGIQSGDRVAILSANTPEMVFLFLACQRIGACLVPLNYRLAQVEIQEILYNAQVSFILEDPSLSGGCQHKTKTISTEVLTSWIKKPLHGNIQVPFNSTDETPVMLLYTSGTTGSPKGVIITQKMLFWNSLNTTLSLDLSSQDISVSFLPLFHTGGWNVLLTPFIHRGATTILLPKFDGVEILKWIEAERATILFGVPTTLSLMTQVENFKNVDLSSLRFAVVGGEPMSLSAIHLWHNRGIAIRQGFGMTECGPNLFSLHHRLVEQKLGSIGRPNMYLQWRLVDEQGKNVEVNQVGELWLNGPTLTPGYYNNFEANQLAFEQGWFKSGDLLRYDLDGDFYVVGRKKDMFISGGENVYPAEIEKVLSSHPDILEAAVIPTTDLKWGEVGHAFVVAAGDHEISESELMTFCIDRLAKFKIPRHFTFLDTLPKTDSNKILKRKLKELA